MTTQQLYQKVINEQMTQNEFLYNVRRDTTVNGILTNTMSYEDTIKVLKAKGHVWDQNTSSDVKGFDFIGTMKSINEAAKKTNKLKGGKGDKLSPDQVNYYEFRKGWKHEMEHTDDIEVAKEIALDHLAEDPNYYTRLDMVELQAKKEKKKESPLEAKKGNFKDKENQMVSPKGIEKYKKNVGNKKEKAKKITGVKTMKGGSEAPKVIKEEVEYNSDQFYMWKVTGDVERKGKLSKKEFDNLVNDKEGILAYIKPIKDPGSKPEEKPKFSNIDPKISAGLKDVGINKNLEYEPTQIYAWQLKNGKPESGRISKSIFHDFQDNRKKNVLSFDKVGAIAKPKNDVKKPDVKLYNVYIVKGPSSDKNNLKRLSLKQIEDYIKLHGKDSIHTIDMRHTNIKNEPVKNEPASSNKEPGEVSMNLANWIIVDKETKKTKGFENREYANKAAEKEPGKYDVLNKIQAKAKGIDLTAKIPSEKKASETKNKYEIEHQGKKQIVSLDKAQLDFIKKKGYKVTPVEDIKEYLDKETKSSIESSKVSFIISGDKNPDQKVDVSDTVASSKYDANKNELVITLSGGGELAFTQDAAGNVVGVYFSTIDGERKSTKVLDILAPLNKAIYKVFAQKKEEPVNEALENYIRKRIQEAIKLAENDNYSNGERPVGKMGPDPLKKKLKEFLQRYDFGYKDEKPEGDLYSDPAEKARGQQATQDILWVMNELKGYGPKYEKEAVDIFNSFADEKHQISSIDDLGGTNATNANSINYDPNAITQNGGRFMENVDQYLNADINRLTPSTAKEAAKKLWDYISANGGVEKNKKYYDKFKLIADKFKKQ